MFSVLVYCHNYNIDTHGHYLLNYIGKKINEYNIANLPIKIETLDILKGGTYSCDGFTKDVISNCKLVDKFDLVFIPDCGGKWYKCNESHDSKCLIDMINNVKMIVKNKGHLIYSKILYPTIEHILNNYFHPIIEKENKYGTIHFIIDCS